MFLFSHRHKRILFCPLNWGLGHATRIIPLAEDCLLSGKKVIIAADGRPLQMLKNHFGERVDYVVYPSYEMRYWKNGVLSILLQSVPFAVSILFEHWRLQRIIDEHRPDVVVSDNRYGSFSSKVKSVFVTHQLFICLPAYLRFLSYPVRKMNHFMISRFSECWVPDTADAENLSGDLSHGAGIPFHCKYIGLQSRFGTLTKEPAKAPSSLPGKFILVMLSGPEPQRSALENKLKKALAGYTVVWFLGKPEKEETHIEAGHWFFHHAADSFLAYCIEKSVCVICRSGYSTLMDLAFFDKQAILIPTPGQTEQLYLADYLSNRPGYQKLPQNKIHELDGLLRPFICGTPAILV